MLTLIGAFACAELQGLSSFHADVPPFGGACASQPIVDSSVRLDWLASIVELDFSRKFS
jgi:hypothetical protein